MKQEIQIDVIQSQPVDNSTTCETKVNTAVRHLPCRYWMVDQVNIKSKSKQLKFKYRERFRRLKFV